MNNWHAPVERPKCGSEDTHFVEPHDEMSAYECNDCGCCFEIEEG